MFFIRNINNIIHNLHLNISCYYFSLSLSKINDVQNITKNINELNNECVNR